MKNDARTAGRKNRSHCLVRFPCSGRCGLGNTVVEIAIKRCQRADDGTVVDGNTFVSPRCASPISGNRLESVQNKDRFCFFFKIVEIE